MADAHTGTSVRRKTRRATAGQALVEFGLVVPIMLAVMLGSLDATRAVYIAHTITQRSEAAARILAQPSERTSDCDAMQSTETGNAVTLKPDPNSLIGDYDPTGPNPGGSLQYPTAAPPSGVGYVYIYPAVANAVPQDATPGCALSTTTVGTYSSDTASGAGARNGPTVMVKITYHFGPYTPIFNILASNLELTSLTVEPTNY